MNFGERNKRRLRAVFTPLFAFILVLSTVLPSMVFAAEGDSTSTVPALTIKANLTEEEIKKDEGQARIVQEITLKLEGVEWATESSTKQLYFNR